jgi:hypothetical protein
MGPPPSAWGEPGNAPPGNFQEQQFDEDTYAKSPGAKFAVFGFDKQKKEIAKHMEQLAYEIKGANNPHQLWTLERKEDRADAAVHRLYNESMRPPPPRGRGGGLLMMIIVLGAGVYWYNNQDNAEFRQAYQSITPQDRSYQAEDTVSKLVAPTSRLGARGRDQGGGEGGGRGSESR